MQTIRSLCFILAAVVFSLPTSARAADIAFFAVEGPNLKPEDSVAIGELLAQSYASVSGQAVLAPSRIQILSADYSQAARELGVTEYVRTDAIAVGDRLVIHAVRYQADGTALYQVKLTADRVEDVPTVADRMARSLHLRVSDEEVRTRHNVMLAEGKPETRRWAEKLIGFKTGLHMPFAKGAKYSPSLSGMFDLRMESDRFFLEFGAGILVPTEQDDDIFCTDDSGSCQSDNGGRVGGLVSEIGGSYFLTDGNLAPYVGGGLMPRLIFSSLDDIANLAVYGQVGITMPRDSSTRFYVDARIAQNAIALHLDNDRKVFPTELSLHAGVGW